MGGSRCRTVEIPPCTGCSKPAITSPAQIRTPSLSPLGRPPATVFHDGFLQGGEGDGGKRFQDAGRGGRGRTGTCKDRARLGPGNFAKCKSPRFSNFRRSNIRRDSNCKIFNSAKFKCRKLLAFQFGVDARGRQGEGEHGNSQGTLPMSDLED